MNLVELQCEICGGPFAVKPYRVGKARFCGQVCGGRWHARTRLAHAPKPWMRGNKYRVGLKPADSFPVGHVPWNRGMRGIHLSPASEFQAGHSLNTPDDVGAERTRVHRGKTRVWVKVAQPSQWRLRAHLVWETENPPIARGMVLHHINHDSVDDRIENLRPLTRAEHMAEHRAELLQASRAGQASLFADGGIDP